MPTLEQQIEDVYLLMLGARERGDWVAECRHRTLMDDLLARVPHDTRF